MSPTGLKLSDLIQNIFKRMAAILWLFIEQLLTIPN